MMPFDYFLKNKEVKKTSPNLELAKSLIKDMNERISKANMLDTNMFAKIVFENIYDGLRDFCDALLALDGFKSYSHQASISYLLKKGFDVSVVEELDQLRYKRNGSKYYGEVIDFKDAQQIKEFYNRIKVKIKLIIGE
jgi:hypothetical protein